MDIVIRNLVKRYGRVTALDDVNLVISPGIHGLLGPNGAGKTTLIRILATILGSDGGDISWGDSVNWRRPMAIKGMLGYLPQQFGMYKCLRVDEALKSVALFKDIPAKEEARQIALAMERTNLTGYARRKVGQLSGGMLRRMGIAQAILGEPALLIMDEPSVGLDPEERINMRKIIREYATDGRVVLLSSHIVSDMESLCDAVTIMHRGRVLVSGSTVEVQSAAEHRVKEEIMSEDALRQLEKSSTVIQFIRVESGCRVRYLSDETVASGEVAPTLEDSYTYIVKKDKAV